MQIEIENLILGGGVEVLIIDDLLHFFLYMLQLFVRKGLKSDIEIFLKLLLDEMSY